MKQISRFILFFISFVALLFSYSCQNSQNQLKFGLVQTFVVTQSNPFFGVGGTNQLTARAYFSSGDSPSADVTSNTVWRSSETSVATVSPSGLVTGVGSGVTRITGTYTSGNNVAIYSFTLNFPASGAALKSVDVSQSNPNFSGVGSTEQLTATGNSSDGTRSDLTNLVTWYSSNANVATVSSSGLVTLGATAGVTTITSIYTVGGVSFVTSFTLDTTKSGLGAAIGALVITPHNLTLTTTSLPQQLTATGNPGSSSATNVTTSALWTSSNTAIATVSSFPTESGGLLRIVGQQTGPVTITATYTNAQGATLIASNTYTVTQAGPPAGQFFGATGDVQETPGTTTATPIANLCSVYAPPPYAAPPPLGGITNAWCSGGYFYANSTLDGSYRGPDHIAFDGTYIYVAQFPFNRVDRILATTGAFAGSIGKTFGTTGVGVVVGGVSIPACTVGVQTTWCAGGTFQSTSTPPITEDGAFSRPMGITVATDPSNGISYVYLNSNSTTLPAPAIGNANSHIQRFVASTGAFAGSIGNSTATGSASSYTANGVVYTIPACAIGAQTTWCAGGTFADAAGDGMFDFAQGMTASSSNNYLYVVDKNNNRVQRFVLSTGAFAGAIGRVTAGFVGTPTPCVSGAQSTWCYGGTFSNSTSAVATARDGMFYFNPSSTAPEGIALDSTYLYVSDMGNNRIEKFTLAGAFVGAVGKVSSTAGTCPASGSTNSWCTGGGFDTGTITQADGNFTNPSGLAVDPVNNFLYVTDRNNDRVVRLNLSTGEFMGALGYLTSATPTASPISFVGGSQCPANIVAPNEWCYGGNFGTGTVLGNIDGRFNLPMGIVVDPAGFIYVGDTSSRIIKIQ